MAEQQTVNLAAEGSSPSSGAITRREAEDRLFAKWGNDAWFVPAAEWAQMIEEELQK